MEKKGSSRSRACLPSKYLLENYLETLGRWGFSPFLLLNSPQGETRLTDFFNVVMWDVSRAYFGAEATYVGMYGAGANGFGDLISL